MLPDSLWIQPPIHTKRGYSITERAGWSFLLERIRVSNYQKATTKLQRILDEQDYSNATLISERGAERIFLGTKKRQIKKINKIKKIVTWERTVIDLCKWVVNLS